MLAMAEGDAEAFDLVDVADAYKDIYRFLRDRVAEEKAVRPREKWLRQVSVLLERGRLGPEELRKTSRSG